MSGQIGRWSLLIIGTAALLFVLSASLPGSRSTARGMGTPTTNPPDGGGVAAIDGLSRETVDAFQNGQGAGVALPAEFVGFPDPRYVLDLADKLQLSADQRARIQALYATLKPEAIGLGQQILDKEAALEQGFHDGTMDETALKRQVAEIAALQAQLRVAQLQANLATSKLLSAHQIMLYNMARGFSSDMSHPAMTATPSRQDVVHQNGSMVMPFDVNKTTHIFKTLDNGGVEIVIAKDPADTEQISLIRAHLQKEAQMFSRGDFSDPAAIHGHDMPGLAQLEAGAAHIQFVYAELPNGAQISYITQDSALLEAIHEWFAAQVSDHGQDASSQ